MRVAKRTKLHITVSWARRVGEVSVEFVREAGVSTPIHALCGLIKTDNKVELWRTLHSHVRQATVVLF